MLIRCPQCSTGFNLSADKIPQRGAKVKCSACAHVFRVRIEDDEPKYFYKKGEKPTGHTMIAPPSELGNLESTRVVDDDASTQFGFPQRSKSSVEGYNPFPLAGSLTTSEDDRAREAEERNNSTHLMGSVSEVHEDNDSTRLGPHGLAEPSSGDRTQLGAPTSNKSGPPPLRANARSADESSDNNRTQAFGSRGIDLFDSEVPPMPDEPPSIDIDPFGDAFDEPVGDVGLLMPSTPTLDGDEAEALGLSLESSSEVGISEEDFLLGGARSDFGDAASLIADDFGSDVPAFDANAGGVVDVRKRSSTGRRPGTGRQQPMRSQGSLELAEVRDPPSVSPQHAPAPAATRTAERPRPARPVPAYVNKVGATSPIRRTFDMIFIALVVGIGFVALVASMSGGFIDFARFGHMVEVAFAGADFVPREEWKQIVEIPPPDPPPDEPLRVENLRAVEKPLETGEVLVISGRIRNYSLQEFKAVKINVVVTNGEDVISKRTETVGQQLDRKKYAKAKSIKAVTASLQAKLPDVGKEGVTYFAVVLDDVPAAVIENGEYDYSVTVAE